MGLVPLGVICEGGNVHMGWPWPWGAFLPAERQTGTDRGLEGLRLCLQGLCLCWLASNQDGERPGLMAAALSHFPDQIVCWEGC